MILKKTWINAADNTNVIWLQTFHLYKGFHRKQTTLGFFIKASARIVEPPRLEYKGFKFKYNKKGDICRGLVVRTSFKLKRLDNSVIKFFSNNVLLIRKRQELKSKYLYGPISTLVKRKRFVSIFNDIL